MSARSSKSPTGGELTVDPTENVKALSEAANKRQDDLRDASEKYLEARVAHVESITALRASHAKELSDAEAKRIDAIRAVDVNAVAVASERATASAGVLATQVAQSADALRTLVATTAATMAEQSRQLSIQFDSRLTAVERSQYEGRGQGSVRDPQMAELVSQVQAMRGQVVQGEGRGQGMGMLGQILVGLIGAAGVIFGIVAALSR